MTGINQGRPEAAIGEPIRFGEIDGFELEHHPISDRLIVRDTQNGTVAYVKAEETGQIGGDGVLIRALKEGKPMADDGRTHDSIQAAEQAASSWVFVPPGTYNESVKITTKGLTLQGSGYNTLVDEALKISESNVTVSNLRTTGNLRADNNLSNVHLESIVVVDSPSDGIYMGATDSTAINCRIIDSNSAGIFVEGNNVVSNCYIQNPSSSGYEVNGSSSIVSNSISTGASQHGIVTNSVGNHIFTSNRIINSNNRGVYVFDGNNVIIANNRVSDSTNADILDEGTGGIRDGNLTGASN